MVDLMHAVMTLSVSRADTIMPIICMYTLSLANQYPTSRRFYRHFPQPHATEDTTIPANISLHNPEGKLKSQDEFWVRSR